MPREKYRIAVRVFAKEKREKFVPITRRACNLIHNHTFANKYYTMPFVCVKNIHAYS